MKHTQHYSKKRHITPRQEGIKAAHGYLLLKKKSHSIFEYIEGFAFMIFFFLLIFGVPWLYYISTGNMIEF